MRKNYGLVVSYYEKTGDRSFENLVKRKKHYKVGPFLTILRLLEARVAEITRGNLNKVVRCGWGKPLNNKTSEYIVVRENDSVVLEITPLEQFNKIKEVDMKHTINCKLNNQNLVSFVRKQRNACKVLGQEAWVGVYKQIENELKKKYASRRNEKLKLALSKLRAENRELKSKLYKVGKSLSFLQEVQFAK